MVVPLGVPWYVPCHRDITAMTLTAPNTHDIATKGDFATITRGSATALPERLLILCITGICGDEEILQRRQLPVEQFTVFETNCYFPLLFFC